MAGNVNTATKVKQLVEPIIENLNIELVETEYVKEGSQWFLRLYIDKPGGVSLDDCQLVHESVTDIIDEADPISGPYVFEVSSPGLDRPIKTEKDYNRVMGQKIDVKLYKPVNGNKQYTGIVCAYEEGEVELDCPEGKMRFNLSDIALARLHIEL